MRNRVFLSIVTSIMSVGVCSGQDYIRNALGLGKKAPPKSDPSILKGLEKGQVPPDYLLTPKHGPCHIFVASYVGERGPELAVRLASELRNTHGIPAYIHNYKEKEPFYRPDAERLAEMRKQFLNVAPRFPQLKTPLQDNWVVVVGDFTAIENDRSFDSTMKKLRRLNRESFSPNVANELRWGTDANRKNPNELVGLRGTANPLRPKDQRWTEAQLKTFKLIKEMNDPEPYCIYKLRKPYTLCVYKFSAATGIAKAEKKSFFGGGEKKKIDMGTAADNARIFCKLLRDSGEDAYIFHSDIASVVCVNGYEGRNDPQWGKDFEKYSKMNVRGIQLAPDLITTPRDPVSELAGN